MAVAKTLIMHNKKRSPEAEMYRKLRTNLIHCKEGALPQVIAISSAIAGEGKSTTSANLAIAFAQTGRKVLLVDCDMRKASVHQFFSISRQKGMSTVLKNPETIEESIQYIEECKLFVLPAGPSTSDPTELLSRNSLVEVFDKIKTVFDVIIVDTPPVGLITDAALISPVIDAYLLVTSESAATVSEVKTAKDHLDKAGAFIAGLVFNKLGSFIGKSSYYYRYYYSTYYYSSYYGTEPSVSKKAADEETKSSKKKEKVKKDRKAKKETEKEAVTEFSIDDAPTAEAPVTEATEETEKSE